MANFAEAFLANVMAKEQEAANQAQTSQAETPAEEDEPSELAQTPTTEPVHDPPKTAAA